MQSRKIETELRITASSMLCMLKKQRVEITSALREQAKSHYSVYGRGVVMMVFDNHSSAKLSLASIISKSNVVTNICYCVRSQIGILDAGAAEAAASYDPTHEFILAIMVRDGNNYATVFEKM